MNLQQFKEKLETIPMSIIAKVFFNHFGWEDFRVSNGVANRIISPYRAAEKTGSFSINDNKKIFKDFGGEGIGGSNNYSLLMSFFEHGVFIPQEIKSLSLTKKIQLSMDLLSDFFLGEKISLSAKTPPAWNKILDCIFNNLENKKFTSKTLSALTNNFSSQELNNFNLSNQTLSQLINKEIIPWTHEGDNISFAFLNPEYKTPKLFEYEKDLVKKFPFGIDNIQEGQTVDIIKYPSLNPNKVYVPTEQKDYLLNSINILKDKNIIINFSPDYNLSQQNIDTLFLNGLTVMQNYKWLNSHHKPKSLQIFQNKQLINDLSVSKIKQPLTSQPEFFDPKEKQLKQTLQRFVLAANKSFNKQTYEYFKNNRSLNKELVDLIKEKHKLGFFSFDVFTVLQKITPDYDMDFLNLMELKIITPQKVNINGVFCSTYPKQAFNHKIESQLPNNIIPLLSGDKYVFFQSPFFNKVIIPTFDENKKVTTITARKIFNDDVQAKYSYLSTSSTLNDFTSKSKNIFNIENIDKNKELILVEGQFDAISLFDFANENVVSLGGSKISSEQIQKLQDLKIKNVVLGFDNDATGKVATIEVGKKLSDYGFNVSIVSPNPKFKDFDEFVLSGSYPKDFIKNNKVSLLDFILKQNILDLKEYQNFKKFFEAVEPLIKTTEDKQKVINFINYSQKQQINNTETKY